MFSYIDWSYTKLFRKIKNLMLTTRCKAAVLIAISLIAIMSKAAENSSGVHGRENVKNKIFILTFRSQIDGSAQPMLVKLPIDYTSDKAWPLLVTLHGLGDGPILATDVEKMVQIGPYGRGSVWFKGIGRQDIFECIKNAKKLFNIDEDRIFLCGFSMGAIATFDIGLKFPHKWAACVPVCGKCPNLELIQNAQHLPFWINTGKKDSVIPPKYSKKAYRKAQKYGFENWKYTQYDDLGHSFSIDWKQIEKWLLKQKRCKNPKRVSFTTENLKTNRAYWVELTQFNKYESPGTIQADINGQTINVSIKNIYNYKLYLNDKLLDCNKPVRIIENNNIIFNNRLNNDAIFVRRKISPHTLVKRPGLSGPLWDIYSSSSLLVYGTKSADKLMTEAAKECAESFAYPKWMEPVTFKIVPDTNVNKSDIEMNNLVLFGNEQSNQLLAKIKDALPVSIDGNIVRFANKQYKAEDIGYVLIYPNPLNHDKYVAVFAASTPRALNCFDKIWPAFNSVPRKNDFGVFEYRDNNKGIEWLKKGIFNSNWK